MTTPAIDTRRRIAMPNLRVADGHDGGHERSIRLILVDALVGACAVLVVAAPLLFTESGFSPDFTNHLWLVGQAGRDLMQQGSPGFFFNVSGNLGVFYPLFAFYGGTLYALTGGIGEALAGHVVLAYVAVTVAGIGGAYCGTLWLARQLGVRGLMAHAPALTVVTSAYYVTDLYGRGAWPELMATSALPLVLASALWLVRAPRWRVLPVAALLVSTMILSGSHNLTLLWGTTIAAGALLVVWLAWGRPRLPLARLVKVAALSITGALINAWFLLPDLAYERNVRISRQAFVVWSQTSFFNTPAVLLDPLRYVPKQSTTPGLFVQAPDWFLVWGLAAGALLLWRRGHSDRLRRAWIAALTIIVLLLAMIMVKQFWEVVPFPFDTIQFPYRLNSYLALAVAGIVMVGVLALQRRPAPARGGVSNGLRLALAGVTIISVGLCVWQTWVPNVAFPYPRYYSNRSEVLADAHSVPDTWYDGGAYRDTSAPLVHVPNERGLEIPPSLVRGDRFAAWMNVPPGPQPIATNILGGAYLVHIAGLKRVGAGPNGEAVVERPDGGSEPVHVVIETAHSLFVELGRVVSLLALLAALLVLVAVARGRRRYASATGQTIR